MRTLVAFTVAMAIMAAVWQSQEQPSASAPRYPCIAPQVFGDLDGNHAVDAADALWVLRDIAHLPLPEGGAGCSPKDIDCDGDESAVDALKLLRHIAHLSYEQTSPCPTIGSTLQ